MATQTSESPANKPSAQVWPIAVPILALLFQAVPPLILCALAGAAYDPATHPPHEWERPVSLLLLGVFALINFTLGSAGIYGLLTRTRPIIAWPLIVICCVPTLLAGATYLHALLVFLTWV